MREKKGISADHNSRWHFYWTVCDRWDNIKGVFREKRKKCVLILTWIYLVSFCAMLCWENHPAFEIKGLLRILLYFQMSFCFLFHFNQNGWFHENWDWNMAFVLQQSKFLSFLTTTHMELKQNFYLQKIFLFSSNFTKHSPCSPCSLYQQNLRSSNSEIPGAHCTNGTILLAPKSFINFVLQMYKMVDH